ncbi:MAG: DUF4214 domain-containing protein [Helicobacter sp.]|nr:DUF4214 domain-containing protein [Helicobacter sp.]
MATIQQISQLFITVLNRVVDAPTMAYWTQKGDYNPALVESFLSEKAAAQSGQGTKDFIQMAYKNALGKLPADDPEGMQWWEDQVSANSWSRADFLVNFLHTIDLYRDGTIAGNAAEKQAVALFDVKFALGIYASNTLKDEIPDSSSDSITFGKGLTDITTSNLATALGTVQEEIGKLGKGDGNDSGSGTTPPDNAGGDSQNPDDSNDGNNGNTEENDNGGTNWNFGSGGNGDSGNNELEEQQIDALGVNPNVPTDSPIA